MKNVRIKKHSNGTWIVIADTERFGKNEIMYESYRKEDCVNYLRREGVCYYEGYVDDDESIIGQSCGLYGMSIRRNKNEWKVADPDGTHLTADTFAEATLLLWNMAPNHDVSNMVCQKACDRWNCLADGTRLYAVV